MIKMFRVIIIIFNVIKLIQYYNYCYFPFFYNNEHNKTAGCKLY